MTHQHDTKTEPSEHPGSCHCGLLRYAVRVDLAEGGMRCNCSICQKLGVTTAILKPRCFRLVSAGAELAAYEWGSKVTQRFFCPRCGTHCFARGHLPELGGDFVAVNLNTLDGIDVNELRLIHWDGRHDNWEMPRDTPWPVSAPLPAAS